MKRVVNILDEGKKLLEARKSDNKTLFIMIWMREVSLQHLNWWMRIWLIFLLFVAFVIVFVAFPYALFSGEQIPSHFAVLCFWLAVGRYAYVGLFRPDIFEQEHREENELNRKYGNIAKQSFEYCLIFYAASTVLIFSFLMASSLDFEPSIYSALVVSVPVGFFAWMASSAILDMDRKKKIKRDEEASHLPRKL
jgi:hypothetical protein